jgi:antitoxin PrlF
MTASIGVKVAANGRLVLPVAIRKAMGIDGETKVYVSVKDGEARLKTISQNVREAQAMYRKYAKKHSTVDDFLRERKEDEMRRDEFLNSIGRK